MRNTVFNRNKIFFVSCLLENLLEDKGKCNGLDIHMGWRFKKYNEFIRK